MSSLNAFAPKIGSGAQRTFAAERAAYHEKIIKIVCALLIAVCFWFAVPYVFPLELDPDPMRAAVQEAAAYEGNLSRQIAMPLVMLVSAYALYRLPRTGSFFARGRLLLVSCAYLIWAAISLAWSEDPAITRKRLVVLGINVLFVVALARVAKLKEIALLGFCCTGAVALIALWADAVTLHTFSPLNPDYRFMGVMTANFQAMNLFVCLTCGLTLAGRDPRTLRRLSPLLALFAVLLFLTRARIGTLLFVAALAVVAVRLAKQWLQPHSRAVALLLALAAILPGATFALGRSGLGAVASLFMMGRQDTENTASLSNRAPLWAELSHSVAEHPLLGSGFEAFWSPQRVQKVSASQGWVVPHAHNTYLDQTLSLGLIGCFLYTAMLGGACWVAWRRYTRNPDALTLFPALLLSWLALLSFTESIPLAPDLPTLLAYTCIAKMCMTEETEPALRARPGFQSSLARTPLGVPVPAQLARFHR